MENVSFAETLKDLRRNMGLSQTDMAKRLNVAQSTIGMWEAGRRTPKLGELNRIAMTLDITVARLLGRRKSKVEIHKDAVYVDGHRVEELDADDIEQIMKHISELKASKGTADGEPVRSGDIIKAKKILVIDDEHRMCELLYSFLAPNNYKVFLTFNGQMGLEYFNEINPDVVLLDLTLPDIPGLEVLNLIRKVSDVPVVIITAHPGDIADIHLKDLNIDGYIEKPVSLKNVLNTIKHIVGE